MRYRDEKFYWTYQRGIGWPNDYIGPDSMTWWIIEKLVGFTDVSLLRILESVRAYAYLILSSKASARSSIVGNTASALTAQSAFLNNFENVVNRRVDICEDIKRYQDTLSYASSKVDYSIGQNICMLPSNMELKIKTGTVGYNNKILVSDGNFSRGKNDEVNSLEVPSALQVETPVMKSHKDSNLVTQTAVTHRDSEAAVTHKDLEKKADYYPRRRENCYDSFFNWNMYGMVPVSINLFIPRIPNLCLHFKTLKLVSKIVEARRNVFVLWVILRFGR